MNKLFSITQKLRPIIMTLVFIAFIFISINSIMQQESIFMKFVIAIIAIIVLGVSVFYEFLKLKYSQLQKSLVSASNHQETLQLRNQLVSLDKVKGMKDSVTLFDVLFLLDQNKPQEVLNLIDENEKLFKSSLDALLIKRHSIFKAYQLLGNRTQSKKAYQELEKLKETNLNKAKKMNLLYNWQQIEALNTFYNQQDYQKALKQYQSIDTSKYNPRELIHLYSEYKELAKRINNKELVNELNSKIIAINPSSPFKES